MNIIAAKSYSISEIITDEDGLTKKNEATEVSFMGSLAVDSYALEQNYPNPFNPATTIRYAIPAAGHVTLKIYDVLGKEVKTLVNETKDTGRYEVMFDASQLSSGVYIYRIEAGEFTASHKMLLLK
jgi:hypothetical protein